MDSGAPFLGEAEAGFQGLEELPYQAEAVVKMQDFEEVLKFLEVQKEIYLKLQKGLQSIPLQAMHLLMLFLHLFL